MTTEPGLPTFDQSLMPVVLRLVATGGRPALPNYQQRSLAGQLPSAKVDITESSELSVMASLTLIGNVFFHNLFLNYDFFRGKQSLSKSRGIITSCPSTATGDTGRTTAVPVTN